MIVDSSAALSWASTAERTPASQALFAQAAQEQVHVPAIWPFEVAKKLGLRESQPLATFDQKIRAAALDLGVTVLP